MKNRTMGHYWPLLLSLITPLACSSASSASSTAAEDTTTSGISDTAALDVGEADTVETGTGEADTVETGPGDGDTVETGPGDADTVETGPGDADTVETGPGEDALAPDVVTPDDASADTEASETTSGGTDGCGSVLLSQLGKEATDALGTDGPWERCGAFGGEAAEVVRVAANGSRAVLVTNSGDAYVLQLPQLTLSGVFRHRLGRVDFAALSPDGARVATVNDRSGEVAVWNVDSHTLVTVFHRPPTPLLLASLGDVAFSSTGAQLAVVSGSSVDVFALDSSTTLFTKAFQGMRVSFAAADQRLVVAGFEYYGNGPHYAWGSVTVMDAATGENAVELATEFHNDMASFVVAGSTVIVRADTSGTEPLGSFFDATTGAQQPGPAFDGDPVAISSDESTLVIRKSAGEFEVRSVTDGSLVSGVNVVGAPLQFTPDLGHVLHGTSADVLVAEALENGSIAGRACRGGPPRLPSSRSRSRSGESSSSRTWEAHRWSMTWRPGRSLARPHRT